MSMSWLLGPVLVALLAAALVLLVKWLQRCPRCRSVRGPTGVRGSLTPGGWYKVSRMCRTCGHTWNEEVKYDDIG